MTESY